MRPDEFALTLELGESIVGHAVTFAGVIVPGKTKSAAQRKPGGAEK